MRARRTPARHRGTEWARDAARAFHAEVAERVAEGRAVCTDERARLMWIGRGLWSDMGFYRHFQDTYGAVFVWSMYLAIAADGTSLNSGLFPDPVPFGDYGREHLANLHTPTLFMHGGPGDVAYRNSLDNYALVGTSRRCSSGIRRAGTPGSGRGLRNGQQDATMIEEAVTVVVQWLDFTLNGNRAARAYFLGPCGLCDRPDWTVESKGF